LGKVRISKVKSVSNELVNKYGNVFTTDFETNKKLICQYSDIRSKHLNNRVAGYVTRLLISKKKRAEALAAEEAELASQEAAEKAGAAEVTAANMAQGAPQKESSPQAEPEDYSEAEPAVDEAAESEKTRSKDASKEA
jgi:small subunit ribosomal protein S17e